MRTFYLRFRVYAIKIMAFQRNVSPNLPMLLVSLYANSLYASQFFRSLSIAYNEGRLYSEKKTEMAILVLINEDVKSTLDYNKLKMENIYRYPTVDDQPD